MATDEQLNLVFDAEPGSVPIARAALAELAGELGMDRENVDNLKTVVTEACANVVRHAYPDGGGRFELEACRSGEELGIVVRDFGRGMSARVELGERSLGIGLGLISELSSHFEIVGGEGEGGTEVRIRVPVH